MQDDELFNKLYLVVLLMHDLKPKVDKTLR